MRRGTKYEGYLTNSRQTGTRDDVLETLAAHISVTTTSAVSDTVPHAGGRDTHGGDPAGGMPSIGPPSQDFRQWEKGGRVLHLALAPSLARQSVSFVFRKLRVMGYRMSTRTCEGMGVDINPDDSARAVWWGNHK